MSNDYDGKEKREFFRYRHITPANFKEVSKDADGLSDLARAVTKDLSASGMLFTSAYPPRLSSIIVLDVDYRTSRLCEEIEDRVMIFKNKLLGKVVRIEDNDNGTYDIGVAFIKKSEDLSKSLSALINNG